MKKSTLPAKHRAVAVDLVVEAADAIKEKGESAKDSGHSNL